MSLMSKLLSLVVVTTLTISAGTDGDDVKDYVKKHMIKNAQVRVTDVEIISSKVLDEPKGWEVFFLNINANVKKSATVYDKVTVPETLFVKDGYTVPTLINLETGEDYKNLLKPELKSDVYSDKHLIAGNKDAEHKLVVFSDPQCPFCQTKVPEIYKAVKANPKKLALYYYHFPLLRIHPVSDIITRAMLVEQNKGNNAKAMEFYSLKINPREVNATKVLAKINKEFKVNISEEDINTQEVAKELIFDKNMATKSMVSGTPTVYIDGKWDASRNKYKALISKDK
ncbi:MAG: Secreted protein, suppressor for copper-sensitivity ScsC [uncultured Sulfurovum sp.]|uniref:Secreted protein, suppressor for copper-sensitivity ScsC n=1 Tax=uncultured Sulfurovum sp. TaxID=269237 RepID=A0A6S6TS43_9BACT|nr:MAG: Secreted protein, suppressor for copper-sensitivity ScsC [uncultured Sulfurovum sp.]